MYHILKGTVSLISSSAVSEMVVFIRMPLVCDNLMLVGPELKPHCANCVHNFSFGVFMIYCYA